MKNRIVCCILGLILLASSSLQVMAATETQLKAEKKQAESQLNETNSKIGNLSEKQTKIQSEINVMDGEMVDLMIRMDATKSDIAATEENIAKTQENIAETESNITVTQGELQVAEANRDKQYKDMKKRIQYIYEHGGSAAWVNVMSDQGNIASFLNRAEYAQSMHEYDRDQLTEYKKIVTEVEELKESLENQKAELQDQETTLEGERTSLESQEKDLKIQQDALQTQIDARKAENSDYENQIALARSQADEISNLIAQQDEEIQRMAQERIREENRKAREEEANRRQQAQQQQSQTSSSNHSSSSQSSSSQSSSSQSSSSQSSSNQSSSNHGSSHQGSSSSNKKPEKPASKPEPAPEKPSGSVSGSSIVAYADQFVGNPYVWGGNSLTNGIDCSHFVYQVLKNTGAYHGGYTTSAGWRSLGSPVAGLAQAQAGDVICYSGHVAIYDGHGGIVEAQSSKAGITHSRSASCSTILAIRRFV